MKIFQDLVKVTQDLQMSESGMHHGNETPFVTDFRILEYDMRNLVEDTMRQQVSIIMLIIILDFYRIFKGHGYKLTLKMNIDDDNEYGGHDDFHDDNEDFAINISIIIIISNTITIIIIIIVLYLCHTVYVYLSLLF